MQQFISKFGDQILGVLSGFDRLVLRGSLRRLHFGFLDRSTDTWVATGMEEYLWQKKVLFKDYAQHVKSVSERVKRSSLQPFTKQDLPVIFLRSASADKEALAREVARQKGISSGWVCAISSLEPSPTFEHRRTHIIRRERPCHAERTRNARFAYRVLYHYMIHTELGWMRLRTRYARSAFRVRSYPDLVSLPYPDRAEWP